MKKKITELTCCSSSSLKKYKSTCQVLTNWLRHKSVKFSTISAVACDFQQCGILTSVDSDELLQPLIKLRNSKLCSVSGLTLIEYSSD